MQGTKTVRASLYFWDWRSRIIVSDIDGTITKSDVFGQVSNCEYCFYSNYTLKQTNLKQTRFYLHWEEIGRMQELHNCMLNTSKNIRFFY